MEATLREIRMQATLADLIPGEKLRISIAGSSWPAIGVNPGHLEKPCGASDSECCVTTINLTLNGSIFQISELLS